MTDKEQIASKCECYTPETKSCSETLSGSCCGEMCQTFNLIKQLARKTQECEELKSESFTREELISIQEKDIDRYRKALEEIESICLEDVHTFADGTELRYDSLDDILDIINNAKGEGNGIKHNCK